MVIRKWIQITLVAILLGGCTTMRGAPQNVLEENTSGLVVVDREKPLVKREEIVVYSVSAVDPRGFRNRVVDHYMGEMDRHYEKYSQRLFNEGIQAALGFDTAILGLASTAALFESAADDLATVVSAFAGTQAAINKNLYFDRTLPALIVTMDAERTKIETEIIRRKALPLADYSLEAAIRDLRRYQQAGTLMRAVTKVTEIASEEKSDAEDAAKLEYERGLGVTCVPDQTLQDDPPKLMGYFLANRRGLRSSNAAERATAEGNLRKLAAAIELSSQGSVDVVAKRLEEHFTTKVCTAAQFESLEGELTTKWGVEL